MESRYDDNSSDSEFEGDITEDVNTVEPSSSGTVHALHLVGSATNKPALLFEAVSSLDVDPSPRIGLLYKISKTDSKLVRATLEANGWRATTGNGWSLMWTSSHAKTNVIQQLTVHQKVNHFPRSHEITRKDRLAANIQRMQQESLEFRSVSARERSMWIVKPVAKSQGRGIYLVKDLSQIQSDEPVVISRYLSDPLLIDGFKFDLRIYIAVTSFSPLRVYMYREGLVRFATERYNMDPEFMNDRFMHLTNYSVNKHSLNFVQNTDADDDSVGNKWSLRAFRAHLRRRGVDVDLLWSRISDLAVKTLISIEPSVTAAMRMFVPHKNNCFELYGFDILVDSNLKPWLLEVNLAPSLACDSPLDLSIKGAMISNLLTLVGFSSSDKQPVPSRIQSASLSRSASDAKLIGEAADENARGGGWERIYPTPLTTKYDGFFDAPRVLNQMMHTDLARGDPQPTLRKISSVISLPDPLESPELKLTPLMAREAFTVYMERMHVRLGVVDRESKKRNEVVLRFLQRAFKRLPNFIPVSLSDEMSVAEKSSRLAAKVREFVANYKVETQRTVQQQPSEKYPSNFARFLNTCTDAELEASLVEFTKRSSGTLTDVFLGPSVGSSPLLRPDTASRSISPLPPSTSSSSHKPPSVPHREIISPHYYAKPQGMRPSVAFKQALASLSSEVSASFTSSPPISHDLLSAQFDNLRTISRPPSSSSPSSSSVLRQSRRDSAVFFQPTPIRSSSDIAALLSTSRPTTGRSKSVPRPSTSFSPFRSKLFIPQRLARPSVTPGPRQLL